MNYFSSKIRFLLNMILFLLVALNYIIGIIFCRFLIYLKCSKNIFLFFVNSIANNNIFLMTKIPLFKNNNLKKINLKGKFLINCNHAFGEIDDFYILNILHRIVPNFDFKNVKSISTVSSGFEKSVFNNSDCIIVDKNVDLIEISKKIDNMIVDYENLVIILFLEGGYNKSYNKIMEKNHNYYFKNINHPKVSMFNLLCKKKYFDYLVDINIKYHKKNKILGKKDSLLEFINGDSSVNSNISIYKLPKNNFNKWLYDLFKKKDIELEMMKKSIVYSI